MDKLMHGTQTSGMAGFFWIWKTHGTMLQAILNVVTQNVKMWKPWEICVGQQQICRPPTCRVWQTAVSHVWCAMNECGCISPQSASQPEKSEGSQLLYPCHWMCHTSREAQIFFLWDSFLCNKGKKYNLWSKERKKGIMNRCGAGREHEVAPVAPYLWTARG